MAATVFTTLFASDRRYRRWFKKWWEQDFSVRGRNASLERTSYFEKIEFGGRLWPREWLPPHDLDGEANTKFQLLKLNDLNNYKWQSFKDITGIFIGSESIDAVSSLSNDMSWCAFANALRGSTRNQQISLESALIIDGLDLSMGGHGVNLNISRILIRGNANIAAPNGSSIEMPLACIGGNLRIAGDAISTNAANSRVRGSCVISGTINAPKIRAQELTLRQSTTRRSASNNVLIDNARLDNLDCGGSYDEVSMRGVMAKKVNIRCVGLKKLTAIGASVESFHITDDVEFIHLDDSKITHLSLSQIKTQEIRASNANIFGRLKATGVDAKNVWLDGISVDGECLFEKSQFHEEFSANGSLFKSEASFGRCGFPGALRFRSSVFRRGANFRTGSGADVSNDVKYSQVGEADFSGAQFFPNQNEVCADFDARQFLEAANFETAKFEGVAKFFGCQFHEDTSFRGAEFKIIPAAVSYSQAVRNLPWRSVGSVWKADKASIADLHMRTRRVLRELGAPLALRRGDHNRRLSNYERSYNALRQRFEKVGNAKEERRFHTYELRARRQRIDANAPLLEGVLSRAYDLVSQYGQSISRPLWFLAGIVWFGFAAIYYVMAWDIGFSQAIEASVFSARQIVKPFSAWSRDFLLPAMYMDDNPNVVASDWTRNLLGIGKGEAIVKTTLVRILASIQSVLGLILLFLSGLAVKRTFGVS